jgi:site-specific recombinase XerD
MEHIAALPDTNCHPPPVESWIKHIRRTKSKTTCQLYEYIIDRFRNFLSADLLSVRAEHIDAYLQYLHTEGLQARSINSHVIAIKSFYHFLYDYHSIPNPAAPIRKIKALPPKQRIITEKEYNKLLKVCKPMERATIELLAHTGLRAAEARGLQKENIDGQWLRILGKGSKLRVIPINATVRDIIRRYPNLSFLNRIRIKPALWRLCVRLSKRAEISPPATPHSLRHYFATRLLQKGVSVAKISKVLGHSSVRTTEIYLHLAERDLSGITDVLC